jgi:hypothetical protein
MAKKEKKGNIDAQWQALQPGWGKGDYQGERRMLYDVLEDGENIERLWCGGWSGRERTLGIMGTHDDGVVVATGRRVLLLNRGRLSKNAAEISYLGITAVQEPEPTKVTVSPIPSDYDETPSDYDLALGLGAAEMAGFLRERLLGDEDSVAAAFSHVLEPGERIRHWARCWANLETVYHDPGSSGGIEGRPTPEYWSTSSHRRAAIAATTDHRILFFELQGEEVIERHPHGTILAVENWDSPEVRFVNVNGEIYAVRFVEDTDAVRFAGLMRDHAPAAARRVSRETRISAEWKLQQPIWAYRHDHSAERQRLCEVLEDHEQIEALAWCTYSPQWAGGQRHSGIIAATGRRLLFVRDGWMDKDLSELPYEDIDEVFFDGNTLFIIPKPGSDGCVVDAIDEMNRHDSREKGYRETFAANLGMVVERAHSQPTAPPSPAAPGGSTAATPVVTETKDQRVARQWQERSDNWDTSQFKNEQAMLCEILADDEDIEWLVDGYWKEDVEGQRDEWGVIAATDRRLVYAYNGMSGAKAAEFPYDAIASVQIKEGMINCRITIASGRHGNDWAITGVANGSGRRFVSSVQSLIANPPRFSAAPSVLAGADVQSTLSRRQRIEQQWTERSNKWELSVFSNEREKLYEILGDDEEIEQLINGDWKEDVKGREEAWGVIAATDCRVIYVYNGREGLRLAELPYASIGTVQYKKGLFDCRIMVVASDHLDWEITNVSNGDGLRFTDCVRVHLKTA